MAWHMQEAKQKLSELVDRSIQKGPQTITRRGAEVAVVISIDEYRRLAGKRKDFKAFLLSSPDMSMLDLERHRDYPRDVEL